jgi:hypothetical protein
MLCESIESHEQGGTDEMDVTRILDPLICPGAWNRARLHTRQSLQACTVTAAQDWVAARHAGTKTNRASQDCSMQRV